MIAAITYILLGPAVLFGVAALLITPRQHSEDES